MRPKFWNQIGGIYKEGNNCIAEKKNQCMRDQITGIQYVI